MTQEDKELLLVDLCARVPHHPKGHVVNACNGAECDEWLTCATFPMFTIITNNCRLYLRPMSSMTEEEKGHVNDIIDEFADRWLDSDVAKDKWDATFWQCSEIVNYLNSIHIDYRGLISKGLAIEAPEGMYKTGEQQ